MSFLRLLREIFNGHFIDHGNDVKTYRGVGHPKDLEVIRRKAAPGVVSFDVAYGDTYNRGRRTNEKKKEGVSVWHHSFHGVKKLIADNPPGVVRFWGNTKSKRLLYHKMAARLAKQTGGIHYTPYDDPEFGTSVHYPSSEKYKDVPDNYRLPHLRDKS